MRYLVNNYWNEMKEVVKAISFFFAIGSLILMAV